jgi:hypothetical protein
MGKPARVRLCRRMCGAGLPRRQQLQLFFGLCPWFGLALSIYWAIGQTKGVAQDVKGTFPAGRSRRHTSGGKAEPDLKFDS